MYSYTMYGAAITVVLLSVVLLGKRVTKIGGIAGLVVGAALTVIWDVVLAKPGGIHAALVSAPIAFAVLLALSLLTKSRENSK